ncbi:hypothetical protein ACSQ67_000647 [Phaseolus vulgaris]
MASVLLLQRDSALMMLLLMLLLIRTGSAHNECDEELSCGPNQPPIRFPFQLIKEMDDPCRYPRICLSCTENNKTMLALPTMKLLVTYIDYESRAINLYDPENCFSNKFNQTINFIRTYQFESPYGPDNNLSFFNCTSAELRNQYDDDLDSQDMISCPIYISNSFDSVLRLDLTSCTKMFDLTAPIPFIFWNDLDLRWSKPNCAECKGKGKRCTWKTNNTTGDTECFKCKPKRIHVPISFIFATTGDTRGSYTFAFNLVQFLIPTI